jgi:hypothetical protein
MNDPGTGEPMKLDADTELSLVLIRLVELWHLGELTGADPEALLDLIARAEAAFDRLDFDDVDVDVDVDPREEV